MPTAVTGLPETAAIGGVPLAAGASVTTFAWMATDLAEVRLPATLRGSDTLKPGAPGVTVNPRRVTSSRRLIPMLFTGDCDSDGAAPTIPTGEQVWVNLNEFTVLLLDGSSSSVTFALSHGALTYTGSVVIEDFDYRTRGQNEIVAVLDLSIPDGRLTLEPGSI